MFKNTAGQTMQVFAYNLVTGEPVNGDEANITVYLRKDDGAVTALTDTAGEQPETTLFPGIYDFDLTQDETNAHKLNFEATSSTLGIVCICRPDLVYTIDTNVTVIASSVDDTGAIEIVGGDDYFADDGRSLDFSFSAAPSLIGSTPTLVFYAPENNIIRTVTGSVLNASQLRFELTSDDTLAAREATTYRVVVELADGHVATLQTGTARVK